MPVGALLGPVIAGGLESLGIGASFAEAIAPIAGGVLGGAALGGVESAITGAPLEKSLIGGAIGGGVGSGITEAIGAVAPGLAGIPAAAIGGGAGGLISSEISGGSPFLGAATGAAGSALGELVAPSSPSPATTTVSAAPSAGMAGGGESAAALAPANINAPGATDLTAGGPGVAGVNIGPTGQLTAGGPGNLVPSTSSTTGASVTPLDSAATGVSVDPFGNLALAPAAASGAGGGVLDTAAGLLKSPLTLPLLAGGGLALDFLLQKPPSQMPEAQPIEQAAAQLGAEGTTLQSYLTTGTLPPGAQAAVDQATNAAKAQIRSNYANLGLTGSTMEASAMNQADQNAAAMTFQIADQLLAQGANFTQLSTQLYTNILNLTVQQDAAFQQALGNFAGGLAGAGLTASLRAAA